ncbi:hypothetical protein BT63DRAFT_470417 [Microthyrium microscopicum]|uniref:F-box domain-containing protein n=1 Tax=Microthyrium microscopicum TaxID=703497 RepID=A0A6A6UAI2_9PEZI|nr:hypothetical protein BT63DRAFT_470417 [Microthyrium microscopicum]
MTSPSNHSSATAPDDQKQLINRYSHPRFQSCQWKHCLNSPYFPVVEATQQLTPAERKEKMKLESIFQNTHFFPPVHAHTPLPKPITRFQDQASSSHHLTRRNSPDLCLPLPKELTTMIFENFVTIDDFRNLARCSTTCNSIAKALPTLRKILLVAPVLLDLVIRYGLSRYYTLSDLVAALQSRKCTQAQECTNYPDLIVLPALQRYCRAHVTDSTPIWPNLNVWPHIEAIMSRVLKIPDDDPPYDADKLSRGIYPVHPFGVTLPILNKATNCDKLLWCKGCRCHRLGLHRRDDVEHDIYRVRNRKHYQMKRDKSFCFHGCECCEQPIKLNVADWEEFETMSHMQEHNDLFFKRLESPGTVARYPMKRVLMHSEETFLAHIKECPHRGLVDRWVPVLQERGLMGEVSWLDPNPADERPRYEGAVEFNCHCNSTHSLDGEKMQDDTARMTDWMQLSETEREQQEILVMDRFWKEKGL